VNQITNSSPLAKSKVNEFWVASCISEYASDPKIWVITPSASLVAAAISIFPTIDLPLRKSPVISALITPSIDLSSPSHFSASGKASWLLNFLKISNW